jgi:predicted transcriptional regulator of viral defense system
MIHYLAQYLDNCKVLYHIGSMRKEPQRQEDRATSLLEKRGMMRLSEFLGEGITSATISRMEQKGALNQLSRGLYQLPDALLDGNHSFAVAAKLVPNGVICYDSALAFHELTDRMPPYVWMAIGPRDWRPKITRPRIQIMRFGPKEFDKGIERHVIEGVSVPIYTPAKTIVDLFKSGQRQKAFYNAPAGLAHATQAMKDALRLRKATPSEIAKYAVEAGIWEKIVQPRLETLTANA